MKKIMSRASVREVKAAALDTLVKTELAKTRAAQATKMSKLKALRLATESEQHASPAPVEQPKTTLRNRKTLHLRPAP